MTRLHSQCFVSVLLLSTNVLLASAWSANFVPYALDVELNTEEAVRVTLSNLPAHAVANINNRDYVRLLSGNLGITRTNDDYTFSARTVGSNTVFDADFHVTGVFLGITNVYVEVRSNPTSGDYDRSQESVAITVLRPNRLIDTMFSVTIVFLLAILFINFGAAIELKVIKEIFRRPVGPGIGSVCQLIFMPLLAYGLGWGLFPDHPEMALGLFLVGIAPAGGASNIWALLMGGNINLSISMTTISTLLCFGTMPLWLLLLGRRIFERANLGVPYLQVALVAASLLIPLCIGLLIQKFLPRVAKFLVRILKPLSLFFIIIVIILGLVTNLYLVELFAWQIVIASLCLPLGGYAFGYVAAAIFRQPKADIIAIAIETGVQNTGLTMFLITFALEQPAADITMVIPIGVSIIGPVPLIVYVVIIKLVAFLKNRKKRKEIKTEIEPTTDSPNNDSNTNSNPAELMAPA